MLQKVLSGIDQVEAMDRVLKGHRLGVISSGGVMNRDNCHSVDVLCERYNVVALFNTVMGIRGEYILGENVPSYVDAPTGLRVDSIFNQDFLAPTEEMLQNIDVLVLDAREAGVRFFEYLHCAAAIMKACAAFKKPFVVLDRIAPLGGNTIEGTVCPAGMHTIVGDYGLATRTALTMGEFLRYVNGAYDVGCDLTVIPLAGWKRDLYFDDTDLAWHLPSPSLPHVTANLLYAGLCILEGIKTLSEGRGTTKPFELVGAPWLDADTLVKRMRRLDLPGAQFARVYFKPAGSKYRGEVCNGVQIIVRDKRAFESFRTAVMLVDEIRAMHPGEIVFADNSVGHKVLRQPTEPQFTRYIDQLLATSDYADGLVTGEQLIDKHAQARAEYRQRIAPYLLYD